MTLISDIESFFGTKNLYDVLGVPKDASPDQIKKAYRKSSLKIHPDRVPESEKDEATKKFQVLAQVHFVLSDEDRRKLYDDHDIIANEDSLDSEADWSNYWRLLFPKISSKDIDKYIQSYIGSEEEQEDMIRIYNRFEGDMDKISESLIGFEEERTSKALKRLIKEGRIEKFDNFCKEPSTKKEKRIKRYEREAKKAEKVKEKSESGEDGKGMDDLVAMIQRRKQGNFDSMIANLERKYAPQGKGVKRKRSNR